MFWWLPDSHRCSIPGGCRDKDPCLAFKVLNVLHKHISFVQRYGREVCPDKCGMTKCSDVGKPMLCGIWKHACLEHVMKQVASCRGNNCDEHKNKLFHVCCPHADQTKNQNKFDKFWRLVGWLGKLSLQKHFPALLLFDWLLSVAVGVKTNVLIHSSNAKQTPALPFPFHSYDVKRKQLSWGIQKV